ADGRNRREMRAHRLEVDGGIERDEPPLVELDLRDQQIELRARDNHARVHELGALDLRYDAHYRVVIRDEIAHGSPPRETLAAIPVDSLDIARTPAGSWPRLRKRRRSSTHRATMPRRPRSRLGLFAGPSVDPRLRASWRKAATRDP